MLRNEGVEVSYDPREEKRGVGDDLHTVVVFLICSGSLGAINLGIAKFREMWSSRGVTVETDDDSPK